jgi:cold shock CspA family protein
MDDLRSVRSFEEVRYGDGQREVVQSDQGYGFIQSDGGGPYVLMNISGVERADQTTLADGAKVSYERDGKPRRTTGASADSPKLPTNVGPLSP